MICDFLDLGSLEEYSHVAREEHQSFCKQMRKKYKELKDEIKNSNVEARLKKCGNRTIIELSAGFLPSQKTGFRAGEILV
jgi:arginine deiminase